MAWLLQSERKLCGLIACLPKYLKVQSASIVSKEFKDPNIKTPAPWPYEKRGYNAFHYYVEGTLKRFEENTKIIVVDGNIGAGKSSFAKQLAEAFDMVYFPEPTLDSYYITQYGYDIRKIDSLLPPSYRVCEVSTFYANPHDRNVPGLQFRMFMLRLRQYIDALSHILNTGQGVVFERSVYSDFVFLEAMHKFGYISHAARNLYYQCRDNVFDELLRPHLIIYLDISPEVALERIKKRNDPIEVNSKVLTKEYLEAIEFFYKQKYLKDLEKHAEVLVYDWSNYGEVEVVVEDIERINFDRFTEYDDKMKDWKHPDDYYWGYLRRRYTNQKAKLLNYACIFEPRVSELYHPPDEVHAFHDILRKIPGERYAVGFNPDAGDKVLFKTKHPKQKKGEVPVYRWDLD